MEGIGVWLLVATVLGLILEFKFKLISLAVETMLLMAEGYNEQYRVEEEEEEDAHDGDDDGTKKAK